MLRNAMMTKAMVLTRVKKPLVFMEIKLQSLRNFDVKVKILFSGICHTQLLETNGNRGIDKFLPHCLGHEASAVVIEIGNKVKTVSVGDKVALSWIKCSGGFSGGKVHSEFESGTMVNSGPVSTFANHAVISEDRCYKLISDIDDKITSILGCALGTGYGLVNRTASVKENESVAIVGAGGIGLSTLIFLKKFQKISITVFDLSESALNNARQILDCDTVNSSNGYEQEYINSFDCVIECSGSVAGTELAYELAKRKEGRVIFSGNLNFGSKIKIDPFHIIEGKKVIGCGSNNSFPEEDFPKIEQIIKNDATAFKKLISKTIVLEDLNEGFKMIEKGNLTRVIVDCRV